jgi:DNA-directed RNA polymerase specialized sigma24 family protein
MNCHSCPHHEDVIRGVYRANPWTESPCAACKLNEIAAYAVPLDADHPPEDAITDLTSDLYPSSGDSSLIPSDVLSQFVQGFLSLPPEQRDVVSWRYQGLQYKEIAERQGVTVSCVEKRHRLAMRDWPVLKSLFPFKVACRRYRRSRR